MFRSKAPRTLETVIAQITKKHGKLLKPDEQFVSVCDAFGADEAHPTPMGDGHRASDFETLASDDQLQRDAEAHLRVNAVRTALGMEAQEFEELPLSRTGYLLAHTERRLFIFDGTGKSYQLQAPVQGLWMQPVDHGDGMYTLVFNNDEERVAVATRRESAEMTKHFIDTFPDRRGQVRVVSLATGPGVIEF